MDGFWGGWGPLGTFSCMTTTPGPEADTPERQEKAAGCELKPHFSLCQLSLGGRAGKHIHPPASGPLKLCPARNLRQLLIWFLTLPPQTSGSLRGRCQCSPGVHLVEGVLW